MNPAKEATMNITTEPVETYIDTLYRPLSEELEAFRAQAENDGIPIILKSTEMFLLNLMNIKRPTNILEIGTAVGYSTACFAKKVKGCSVTSIELDEETHQKAVRNISALNLAERVTVLQGDAETVIREQLSGQTFDFVFIDAAKSHYKRFFDAAVTVCADGALLISDDILLKGGTASDSYIRSRRHLTNIRKMREYLAYLSSLSYADTSFVPMGTGIAITVLGKRG